MKTILPFLLLSLMAASCSSYLLERLPASAPALCEETRESDFFQFKDQQRLRMGDTGTFCSSPVELEAGKFLSVCDGLNGSGNERSGQLVIFDGTLKVLHKQIIESDGERTTLSSINRPLVRRSETGIRDIVLSTKDGRLLFISTKGEIIKTVSLDYAYIENPVELSDGKLAVLASLDVSGQEQRIYFFNETGPLGQVELGEDGYFEGPYTDGGLLFVTSGRGRLVGAAADGKKIDVMIEEGSRLSTLSFKHDHVYVGTHKGFLYRVSLSDGKKDLVYQAGESGATAYDLAQGQVVALRPVIRHAPVFLKNGGMALATAQDGRIHFLEADGTLIRTVEVPIVSGLHNFEEIPGSDLLIAGSISYMTLLDQDGFIKAKYSNSGAENPFTPLPIGGKRYLNGMYNGVFLFEMLPKGKFQTSSMGPCR